MNENFTKKPLIAIVIVTYNNEKDIQACLDSVLNQTYSNFEVIIVDSASTDRTCAIVSERYPNVILLPQKKNLFLVKSNNIGITYAFETLNADYVMVLNSDTYLDTKLIESLFEALMADTTTAAVGPKVTFWNNENAGKINTTGLVFDGFNQAYDRGFLEEDNGQYESEEYVFGLSGVCVLYRRKALEEIGLYWEKIKMYLDDVEIALRFKKKGWKLKYVPKAILGHAYMASTNQNKKIGSEKEKNRVWFWIAMRHYPLKSKIAMALQYFVFNLKLLLRIN